MKTIDKHQRIIVITVITIPIAIIAFLLVSIWLFEISGALKLEIIRLDDQFCSCPGNCSYNHSCHGLLGTS